MHCLIKSEYNRTFKMYLHIRQTLGRLDSLSSPCSPEHYGNSIFMKLDLSFTFFPDKISCGIQIAVPEMDTRRRRRQACQLVRGKSKCQKYGGEIQHGGNDENTGNSLSAKIMKLMCESAPLLSTTPGNAIQLIIHQDQDESHFMMTL